MLLTGIVVYRMELFAKWLLFSFFFIFLAYISIRFFDSDFLAIICFIIAFLPLAFFKKMISHFSADFTLLVDDLQFAITIEKAKLIKTYTFPYNELDAWGIEKKGNQYFVLSLYHQGKRIKFPFPVKESENNHPLEILEAIRRAISTFNWKNNNKILLKPSFYASEGGKVLIAFSAVFITFAMVISFKYATKAFPGSIIFSIGALFQLIANRLSNKRFYEKISNGDPIQ